MKRQRLPLFGQFVLCPQLGLDRSAGLAMVASSGELSLAEGASGSTRRSGSFATSSPNPRASSSEKA